jgi:hypothetical protein
MEFHPRGVKPPLARIFAERGEIPDPDVLWNWRQERFQVSYDGGQNWYDRAAAGNAEAMFRWRRRLSGPFRFLATPFRRS